MKTFPTFGELLRPIDHGYKKSIAELFDAISEHQRTVVEHGQCIKTLCDVCENACGGCEWSEKWVQKPIPGWDAVRRDVPTEIAWNGKKRHKMDESYTVLHCPKFVLEEKWASWYEKWDPEKRRRELECGAPESETE